MNIFLFDIKSKRGGNQNDIVCKEIEEIIFETKLCFCKLQIHNGIGVKNNLY